MHAPRKELIKSGLFASEPGLEIFLADTRQKLASFPDGSFQCCITSPPYWGLRDYEYPDQIGSEPLLNDYISDLVRVFREVRRTLNDDGTLWLNLGDCYTSGGRTWRAPDKKNAGRAMSYRPDTPSGLKPKDLIGLPWKVAFALQADGWYLRSDIVWHKPNCQPESVKDRPTRAHEYMFLLSKSEKYAYYPDAVKEKTEQGTRNRRSIWSINTEGYKGAHFAVFPPKLVELCLLASTKKGEKVLDPFFGTGTVGFAAKKHGRECVGIEMKPQYAAMALKRIRGVVVQNTFL